MSIQVGQEVKAVAGLEKGKVGTVLEIGSGCYEGSLKVQYPYWGDCWISAVNGEEASWTEQVEEVAQVQPVQEAAAPEKSQEEMDDLRNRRLAKAIAYIARIDAEVPALVGSPAQIKWAESIRTPHLERVRKGVHSHFIYDEGRLISIESYFISGSELKHLRQLAEDHDNASASWYIDNRRALTAMNKL